MEVDRVIETQRRPEEVSTRVRARPWLGPAVVVLVALAAVAIYLWTSGAWRGWQAVASLNGTRITRGQLDQHVAFLVRLGQLRSEVLSDPARKGEVERLALDDLITRRLMVAEAERLKITVGPGEEDVIFGKAHGGQPGEPKLAEAAKKAGEDTERMRQEVRRQLLVTRLKEKLTEGVSVSDEDAAQYYERNKQAFTVPGTAHLRLLIVESREEAEKLRAQAVKGANFEALVRRHSKGGATETGGDLGWVDLRTLPPAIAAAVAEIPQADMTPVIEAKGKFCIVRVEGRQGPRQLSLAEVRDQLRHMLTAERKRAKFNGWLEEQRRTAKIEVYLP